MVAQQEKEVRKLPKQKGEKPEYVVTAMSKLWRQARALLTAAIRAEEVGESDAGLGYLRMAVAALVPASE